MIVTMRRLDLLLYNREKDFFLHELQEMGVVHIVETPDKDTASLQQTADLVKRCEHTLAVLSRVTLQLPQEAGLDGAAVTDLPLISDMRDFMPAPEPLPGRAVL